MVENRKRTFGGLRRGPRTCKRQHPRHPRRGASADPAETGAAQLEAVMESVFRAAPLGIGLVSNRVIQDVNGRLCEMVGYRREELIGRNSRVLYPTQQEWEYVGREKYRQIGEQGTGVVETRWQRKDGEVIDVLLSSAPLDPRDLVKGVTFTATDITARKRAEQELRSIFAFSLDMICIADLERGAFTKVNPAFERVLGYSEQELVSRPFVEFIHPEDADRTMEVLRSRLRRGEHVYHFENRFRCKDGSYRWLSWTSHPQIEQGVTYAIARDVTEQKRMEHALRFTQFAVDHAADAAFWMEGNGRFCYVNEAACRSLGYSSDELRQMTVLDIDPSLDERLWADMWVELKARRSFTLETAHRARDGRVFPVEIHANYVEFDGRQYDCAFARDITERKQAEELLQRQKVQLEESEGRLRTLMGNLPGIAYRCANQPDWPFEFVSEGCLALTGYTPEEITREGTVTYGSLIHPEDRQHVWDAVQDAIRNDAQFDIEYRIFTKDGAEKWVSERGRLVSSATRLFLEGFIADITDRKLAIEALRELSRKDEEALRVAQMGHWEYDVASGTFLFNDQYYTLHGTTAKEAGGYRIAPEEFARRYVHPDDAPLVGQTLQVAAETDDPDFQYRNEVRILRADGEPRWITVWFRVEKDAQGRTVKLHGVNQDITERRNAEEALRRLNEHLEQVVARRTEDLTNTVTRLQQLTWELSQTEDRERKRIADILHDDVQQTLAAARFHLNLLSAATRTPEESRELIHQVKQMLKEAIEKARSLSHELSPALYQIDLADTLKWLACHMRDQHGLTVEVKVHGRVEVSSEPVKALLYKVTQELLFNVVKHAGTKEALIRVRRLGSYIGVAVIDRGAGFRPQDLDKTHGFGLLGIRERIQLLGGRMKIRSSPGRGCRLLIAVPDRI